MKYILGTLAPGRAAQYRFGSPTVASQIPKARNEFPKTPQEAVRIWPRRKLIEDIARRFLSKGMYRQWRTLRQVEQCVDQLSERRFLTFQQEVADPPRIGLAQQSLE